MEIIFGMFSMGPYSAQHTLLGMKNTVVGKERVTRK